ncbi:MAG: hypothetical protein RJQ09_16500 [Cyclobacteriaceae bacterium]
MGKLILTTTLMLWAGCLWAQREPSPEARQKIEAARIALITDRLGLSPEQAERFWPVYKEFSEKRQLLREDFMRDRRNHDPKNASEEENRRLVERGMEIKQRQLDLEKEYSDRLLSVIDTRQLVNLRNAEEDFRQMIIRQIERRRDVQDRRQQQRERNQDQIERRRNN